MAMPWKRRAKPPNLPEVSARSGGLTPPLGASPGDLDWFWSAINAGMWSGQLPNMAGTAISESDALSLPAVTGSLQLITTYATQMPLEAVDDTTTPATVIQPTPAILRGPLGDPRVTGLTLKDWVEGVIRDLALWGNYLAVLGDPGWDGWPRVMYPVPPGYWSVMYEDGFITYIIGGEPYAASEVFHVAINRSTGQLVGRGLLSGNHEALNAAIQAERWAARYFQTGTVPSVHISHPNPDLTQAQADDLKQKFLSATMGVRVPVVTPTGTTIDVLPNDADRAQLVEARRWSSAALAIALGVPPAMIGLEGSSQTYRNIEQVTQQLISTTEMLYLVPVEQQLTAQCVPRGQRARFSMAALIRPDYAERMTQAIAGLGAGLLTNAEARAIIDLPPSDELDQVTPQPGADPNAAPPSNNVVPISVPQSDVPAGPGAVSGVGT